MKTNHDSTGYNGWSNYETWNVALWLDNDFDLYSDIRECRIKTRADLADYIRNLVDEMTPDLGASLFSDLLYAALSVVDYGEIADHYLYDADASEDGEE